MSIGVQILKNYQINSSRKVTINDVTKERNKAGRFFWHFPS